MAKLYAGAEWIGPAFVDNFMAGRQGNAVSAIVVHHTASTFDQAVLRFTSSSGVSGGGTSAHFIIDLDGARYQVVDTADTAFHAGNFQANLTTIGIEHVQTWDYSTGLKTSDFTDAQYASSHELCSILAADNGFPFDAAHLHRHSEFTPTACPGDLDMARILTQEVDMTPTQDANLQEIYNMLRTGKTSDGADSVLAKITAGATDLKPVLAAIADLKAHPVAGSDPAVLAIVTRIETALKGA